MIQLQSISKYFEEVTAVDHVSFRIEKGDIYGLLGPNGAGKTTTIRMLMGILEPDEGEIIWNGNSISREDRVNFGYLPEERGLYQKQKLKETLQYFGRLRGVSGKELNSEIDMWLERFDFSDSAGRKIEELSKGNQQKVQFILALLHKPDFIILDEPFTGLDPINQVLLKDIIQKKREEGVTFIFSTHQMEQVERLCTNICLINKGKILIEGSLSAVKEKHRKNAVTVKYEGELKNDNLEQFFPEFQNDNCELSGVLKTPTTDFLDWLNKQVEIISFTQSTPTLEQIFIEEVHSAI
ncbi:MAG: ATP-binding cassette domain-containing protein [Candidatus Marinimicrobia bacterium]|jgi:ABC-2 type transport system ATP-binding protein|nr:ABC transporter [Candidatus Neomarinimicrobiota bacterium]MDP6500165.1 ATP-binding cassette domain-containing protein [Candidatus Neomarinimicrobiota bacterium]MDP6726431.1 ATP-binding cassette domain-containing protein [Candidatus Neomarinimicrobiota bacterium]|tara:strand:- start:16109 stop:16996 length:888 start_codon:yes stop_codon:yes gene_type:complete